MKKGALVGSLLIVLAANAQPSKWPLFRIDKQLAIHFPALPQEMDIPGTLAAAASPKQYDPQAQASRAFRGEDIAATYIVVIVPFSGNYQLPTDPVARLDYYKKRLVPLLMTRAHGEALAQTSSSLGGIEMLTIKFRVLSASGIPVIKYLKQFTVGQSIYQLFFIPKDGTGQTSTTQRARFFDNLVISKPK